MKIQIFLFIATMSGSYLHAQNVGIGTTVPQARLHVTDSAVLFTGPINLPAYTSYDPPASGAGSRMMWYPQKAAFRVGIVDNNYWNKDSMGRFSFATGYNTKAKGEGSFASGNSNTALGSFSSVFGSNNIAMGIASISMGNNTNAIGNYSTSMGNRTNASGFTSVSMGSSTNATGAYSFSMGANTNAIGDFSTSMGLFNFSRAYTSTTMGIYNTALSPVSLVIGRFNDTTDTNRLFEIGNGTNLNSRSNAVTVLTNGNTGLGTSNPQARLHVTDSAVLFTGPLNLPATTSYDPPVSGAGSRMMWYPQKAAFRVGIVDNNYWNKDSIGRFSFATGYNTKAEGEGSFASGISNIALGNYSSVFGSNNIANGFASNSMGNQTSAIGEYSTSMGYNTNAIGNFSTSMGNRTNASGATSVSMGYRTDATGDYSFSMGSYTSAIGDYSTSMGLFNFSRAYTSTTMGNYNTARSPNSLVIGTYNDTTDTNRLFEVGNGTANNARSNALTILTNANVGIGTSSPTRPLSFANIIGKKISFYTGVTGDYGMSVEGGQLRIFSDGPTSKVSFGTDDYTNGYTELGKFEKNGGFAMSVFGSIWANGTIYASDERFKQNISSIQSPLQKLMLLNGVEYEMRKEAFPKNYFMPGRQIGLLAQNVEQVFPEAVSENADGYKGVDYARLVPLLIEAIKEQNIRIDLQQKQIDDLIRLNKVK
jgi:hypothetical protein